MAISDPAAGQLVEHLLVQRLVLVLGTRGQEYVAADELVHHLAVHLGADKGQLGLVGELHRHLVTQGGGGRRVSQSLSLFFSSPLFKFGDNNNNNSGQNESLEVNQVFRQLLYHLYLPVDVPLLHVAEAPGLDGVPGAGVHSDQTVVSDADQLLPLPTLEPARRTQTQLNSN